MNLLSSCSNCYEIPSMTSKSSCKACGGSGWQNGQLGHQSPATESGKKGAAASKVVSWHLSLQHQPRSTCTVMCNHDCLKSCWTVSCVDAAHFGYLTWVLVEGKDYRFRFFRFLHHWKTCNTSTESKCSSKPTKESNQRPIKVGAMSVLDSKAAFSERLKQLGVEDELRVELQTKGFETYGSLAFAVSTTPQQVTDTILDAWLSKVTARELSPYQTSCIRRLVVESHALALNDLQRKVDQPSDPQLTARKLPMAERQMRQAEQETRLEGIIFSPEVTPSHSLVDLCVNMLEQNVLSWIKPEECTSRSQEIQSFKKDPKVVLDAAGNIKIISKTVASTCSVSSELDLRNALQRRSLAMDQARLCSFREAEMWVQHLFLSHERAQPSGFSSVSLQKIIECDKQMFIRASNNLVGKLQSEPGATSTPFDSELRTLRASPELMPYLMPLPSKPAPKAPAAPRPDKRPASDGADRPTKYAKGKGKGKGKYKSKTKQGPTIDLPPGCVAKTPDGKPLCFAFNKGTCGFRGTGPRCQRGCHLCYKRGCHKSKPFHECSHGTEWQLTVTLADQPPQTSVSHQQPLAVEICCGQASLSRSLINAGFSVIAVDHVLHDPQVPVTLLDLTEPQHQRILKDLLHSRPPDYIHLGMPCGTASRARERPVAKSKVLQGAPQPPPLRSADHPLGLPHINPESTSGIRLKKANQLYSFVIDILLIAMKYDIAISLENPYRSWFWAAILALVQAQNNPALTRFWDSLTEVFFHNCCHGGQRKKGTRWKSTPGVFHGLSATCQNDHDHLPYQVHTENGTWTFDTASEAAYPELLTQRVADAIRKFLSPKGFSFAPPPNPRLTSLAMQHRQHKKRGQLIPDFVHLHWFPPNHKLQDLQKNPSFFQSGGISGRSSAATLRKGHLGGNMAHAWRIRKESSEGCPPYGRMRSEQNYERCHRVCLHVRSQIGLDRKEKKPAESKNLAKAVGGRWKVLTQEPSRISGKGGKW